MSIYSLPATYLGHEVRYDKMATAFKGVKSLFANSPASLDKAMKTALNYTSGPVLVNVIISPASQRKPQVR